MKKSLLILMLLVLVVALVACGGDKEPATTDEPVVTTEAPAGDDPAVTTEAPAGDDPVVTTEAPAVTTTAAPVVTTTAAPSKFTVKFVDAEEFDSKVLSELSVSRGKAARAPINPSHDGYIFLGWDVDDYSSITEDMVITATYRPVDTYYVTFYDADGNALTEAIEVKEGAAVEAPQAPVVYGKLFDSWDKQVGKVDRSWADFEQYKDLSAEELAAAKLEYKVTATYKEADGIVAYKSGISMEFKESTDANGKKIYVPVDDIFTKTATYVSDDIKVYKASGADDEINCKATVAVAWDGEFVYAYARVYDPTLLDRGEEYCNSVSNPWENDGIEVYYCFVDDASSATRRIVKVDAFGHRKYAGDGTGGSMKEQSVFFNDIEFNFVQAPESNTYYAIFKIPAKTEAGVALQSGDRAQFSMQINDLRALDDTTNLYCSGGNRDYSNWYSMTLGKAE